MKKIGGFFPLDLPDAQGAQKENNFLSLWGIPKLPHLLFSNARSALHRLLEIRKPKTFWLPAYSCPVLLEVTENTGSIIKFFPVHCPELAPDIDYLKKNIKTGDAVLAIDYFGRNPSLEFIEFAASRQDIDWIEDRVQAMLPSEKPWGDFVLYSPRKLIGVPDGGILVSRAAPLPAIEQPCYTSADFIRPALLRYEDREEEHNEMWDQVNKDYWQNMSVNQISMSRITRHILANIDPGPIIAQRKSNYKILMERLRDISLLPDSDFSFVPFGFPVILKDRVKIADALRKENIFAGYTWVKLASDPAEFPVENQLAANLLRLPLDHRYDAADMERIAAIVRRAL